jgi:autoinducer 2-degrading protein
MVVNIVEVRVKPGHEEAFIAATRKNHAGSRTEAGNLRFDVLRSAEDPTRFVLYEAFASPAAVEAHRATAHYKEWRAAVEPWMAAPRVGKSHSVIAPEDPSAW